MWFGATGAGDMDTALVTAVWAFLGIVVTTLGTIAVQALRSRKEPMPTSSGQAVDGSPGLLTVAKDIGQLDQRADDSDERFHIMDLARTKDREDLDDVLDYLDATDPEWRGRR